MKGMAPRELARMVEGLSAGQFEMALAALTDPQLLAETLVWMTEPHRMRALPLIPRSLLRAAYAQWGPLEVSRMRGNPSWDFWQGTVREGDIQAWAHDLLHGEPVAAWRIWADLDPESRLGVALILSDEQLDALQEILK